VAEVVEVAPAARDEPRVLATLDGRAKHLRRHAESSSATAELDVCR
jgi:hypothetical protein